MDPVGMQAALVVCCAGAAGAWACLNGLRPVDRGVGEAEARGVGGCSRRPGRRPGSRTRLLKEEKGSRRSSYWDEYRSSVSSLPPPCRVGGGGGGGETSHGGPEEGLGRGTAGWQGHSGASAAQGRRGRGPR